MHKFLLMSANPNGTNHNFPDEFPYTWKVKKEEAVS